VGWRAWSAYNWDPESELFDWSFATSSYSSYIPTSGLESSEEADTGDPCEEDTDTESMALSDSDSDSDHSDSPPDPPCETPQEFSSSPPQPNRTPATTLTIPEEFLASPTLSFFLFPPPVDCEADDYSDDATELHTGNERPALACVANILRDGRDWEEAGRPAPGKENIPPGFRYLPRDGNPRCSDAAGKGCGGVGDVMDSEKQWDDAMLE
jgi:hypothetical protein